MGQIVSYHSNGGSSQGYLASPAGGGPGVVVIQEWWGLVPHIESVTDRLAKAGFVALAPDLYHGRHTAEPDEAGKLLMGMAMDQAARDIAGAAAYVAGLPDTAGTTGKVGVVGFCMGGSLALWSATFSPAIVAAVGFYPPLPWETMSPDWSNYAGKAAVIHCSEHDGTSAAPGIKTAVDAITRAGGECATYDYPGTDHAFFNDDRPSVYDSVASATAWARTLAFFRDSLG
jgi:carboxymethylenebutenolidase